MGENYAITCPLITKADGTKFGKTEEGNVWLDKSKTSPYKFYQYWLNSSDRDAERYIKIFTLLDQVRISTLIEKHNLQHERLLQKTLAEEVTQMVHSYEDLEKAQKASNILFGKSTAEDLKKLDEESFLEVLKEYLKLRFLMLILKMELTWLIFWLEKLTLLNRTVSH